MEIDRHNRDRITRVSGILRTVAAVALVGWALMLLVQVVAPAIAGEFFDDGPYTPYFVLALLFPVFGFVVTFRFHRFFARLHAGHLFDPATVGQLHSAGRWWLASWAFGVALTLLGRRLGMTQLQFTFEGLMAACAVLFAAWLFREAQAIQQDHELTV